MIINNFNGFIGQHCETTATGSLLLQMGIDLSEPMLFGLGEGLGFIFWKMKSMDFPFIGGRIKTDLLTEKICRNLNLKLEVKETTSLNKAWKNIEKPLLDGKAVGLKLDCYHLDYFSSKFHFAGHYVAMYGYDDKDAFLIDTKQQGAKVKTSLNSLALARNEKGPMSSRNRSYTIEQIYALPDLKNVIVEAIRNNCYAYLNPPIKNLSYKGILKTSIELNSWYNESEDLKRDFQTTSMLMERAGTGGALFRNLYRDFLKEANTLVKSTLMDEAYLAFKEIAALWTHVSELFFQLAESADKKYLTRASQTLKELSRKEKTTMESLSKI